MKNWTASAIIIGLLAVAITAWQGRASPILMEKQETDNVKLDLMELQESEDSDVELGLGDIKSCGRSEFAQC